MKTLYIDQISKPFGSVAPGVASSGATNGAQLDQWAHRAFSGNVQATVAAPTGGPTSFSVVFQLQDSPDGNTWTNAGSTTNVNRGPGSVTATAAGVYTFPFNPEYQQRYLRVVQTVTFTGGSSPAVGTCANIVLCDSRNGLPLV